MTQQTVRGVQPIPEAGGAQIGERPTQVRTKDFFQTGCSHVCNVYVHPAHLSPALHRVESHLTR